MRANHNGELADNDGGAPRRLANAPIGLRIWRACALRSGLPGVSLALNLHMNATAYMYIPFNPSDIRSVRLACLSSNICHVLSALCTTFPKLCHL
ncbi:hypothetical protein HZ326_24926 [Fusarium oxysporum f. sp. albedinis]|nr:hypothetical protein HZ326_24926 [Fusarium oxysporum f. sp. albedinis]